MAPLATRLTLNYYGPDVDDSTTTVGLVVDALEGFSGAYRKTAAYISADLFTELRVSTLEHGNSGHIATHRLTQPLRHSETMSVAQVRAKPSRSKATHEEVNEIFA